MDGCLVSIVAIIPPTDAKKTDAATTAGNQFRLNQYNAAGVFNLSKYSRP